MIDYRRHPLHDGESSFSMRMLEVHDSGVPMLADILEEIRSYCESLGEEPVLLEVELRSGRKIQHPFPRPKPAARRHGPGFRTVSWDGMDFSFTPLQARAVGVLWEAWENGTSEVAGAEVLRRAGSDQMYLHRVFHGHPAWGTLIIKGAGKGMVRLAADGIALEVPEECEE